jgi:molecular chaperone DnaK
MVVGIDLGTCFSAIGTVNDSPELIVNNHGERITPSCISVSRNEILVGSDALYAKYDPDFVFIDKSKTHMGTDKTYKTPQGDFTPQLIAQHIISHLLGYAKNTTGNEIDSGVVTVPAYFNAHQRKLTKEAAEAAGLKVDRIISEPTAAALASDTNTADGTKILVYDLGGGTFDCSILEQYDSLARVIATKGDTNLGGQDFDLALAKSLIPNFDDLSESDKLSAKDLAEETKRILSSRDSCFVNLKKISPNLLPVNVTLKEFNEVSSDLLSETRSCVYECLKDAELEPSDIKMVYMVGGSTRMRQVADMLSRIFSVKPVTLLNPDEVVAIGATRHANSISGTHVSALLIDVVPLSLGVKLEDGNVRKIIKRNTPIPCSSDEKFTTAFDNQEKVLIEVFQGENELAKNNLHLGTVELSGIKPALRGDTNIMVKFDLDANAVLTISAEDLDSGEATEAVLEYNFDHNSDQTDDETELMLLGIKTKIRQLMQTKTIPDELKSNIDDAFDLNNVEFLQAVLDELTDIT